VERTYLVECYWPGVTEHAYAATVGEAGSIVRAARQSPGVRLLDSLLVPVDESVFYRIAGVSVRDVECVCRRAGLPFTRILEYIEHAPPRDE
jgi:hypothetical protein